MKRKLFAFSMTMALLLSMLSVAGVGAHTIQIEKKNSLAASRTDWFGAQPSGGIGAVQRNSSQQGEFIFNDASKDQRLISGTEAISRATDLDWFGVTADANNIYFLAKVDRIGGITQSPAINLIVTIDTNHTTGIGSGNLPLPVGSGAFSDTNVAADAAWEYAVRAEFKPGNSQSQGVVLADQLLILTAPNASTSCGGTCAAQLASAAISPGSFAELAIPWTKIGGKPLGANFLRFTVAVTYNTLPTPVEVSGFNSPVLDTIGVTSSKTDIIDGQLDSGSAFDVHFDTNVPVGGAASYEPYAPLLVTEIMPDPVGKDTPGSASNADSEYIEIYNPNSFAIALGDYKIGNAATRGSSSQVMLRLPAQNLAAKDFLIIARDKTKFTAVHPSVSASKVLNAGSLTRYTAWASGLELDLDNISGAAAEEQVLILNAKDNIVDIVTYGNPTTRTPGIIPLVMTSTIEGASYERCPGGLDTNGGFIDGGLNDPPSSTDFITHPTFGEQTPGTVCVGRPGLDVSIAKGGPSQATVGTNVAFTLTYNNVGSAGELGGAQATITDTLPAGMTFQSSAPAPTSVNGQTVVWKVAPPAVGGLPSTIVLTATIAPATPENTPLTNRVVISTPNEPTDVLTQGNNQAEWTVSTLGPALLDVSFDGLTAAPPGRQFAFSIGFANGGQSPAQGVEIALTVPTGVTLLATSSATATPGFSTPVSGPTTVTWTVSQLEAVTTGGISITGQVGAGVASGSSLNFQTTIKNTTEPIVAEKTANATLKAEFLRMYIPVTRK